MQLSAGDRDHGGGKTVGAGWHGGGMRRFAQVDVFTAVPGLGNPVAVVLDADGLDDETMARVANWTNLSETTFVLPPTTTADYRVRIFTPSAELPLAGHPTLGTCQALLDAGRLPLGTGPDEWIQESLAGLVTVRRGAGGVLSFAVPAAVIDESPISDVVLQRILGVIPADPMLIGVGPHWITGRITPEQLARLTIDDRAFLAALDPKVGVGFTLYAVDDDHVVHVRSFFEAGGAVLEDPVCGTGNAVVGVHLQHSGRSADVPQTYQARQGSHRGRDGRITVTLGEQVWVGGQATTVVSGTIAL